MLGATQRQGEDRIGRVRGARGREDAGAGAVEVRNLVGLAEAVDHRVRRARPDDSAAHQMDGRRRSTTLPYLLGVRRLGDLEALLKIGVPQRRVVVVIAVEDAAEPHAELVLFPRQLQAALNLASL